MILIGHRGAAALEPENTLLSINRALEIGVDAVEIDVHLTRDNELVVIHDSTLNRTTNGRGLVRDYTLGEIKNLDAGKGEKIPTLQEVINLVRNKTKLIIELKETGTQEGVVELIRQNNFYESSYVISFWHPLVKAAKQIDHSIKTGILLVGCPVDASLAINAAADIILMNFNFIDQGFVHIAHQAGLKVFVWNVDDHGLLKRYADMGVDGISSNDPRILLGYFR